MSILVVFGRTIGERAIRNLDRIFDLADATYKPLNTITKHAFIFLPFNSEEFLVFKNKYPKMNSQLFPIETDYKRSNYISTIKTIHPNFGKIGKKAMNDFISILRILEKVDILITDNETKRGRSSLALLAAKNMLIPQIDLSSKRTEDKLAHLEAEEKKRVGKLIKILIKKLNMFKSKNGFDFEIAKNIEQLEENDIIHHIAALEKVML